MPGPKGKAVPLSLAVLASGRGSNAAALVENIRKGRLNARIAMVLSNNPAAPVLEFARSEGIPVWAQSHREFLSREAFDTAMLDAMASVGQATGNPIGAVVLAGYMRILSSVFVRAFPGRILNIHPALLPAFPGSHAVRDTLAHGAKITGCTVHLVDELLDHGPSIIQAAVPVLDGDTETSLHARIQAVEHRILPQAVQWLSEGRLKAEEGRVRLLSHADSPVPQGEGLPGPWLVSPPLEG